MIRKTLCAIVAVASISGCDFKPIQWTDQTQQSNLPGIKLVIDDLKGCSIEFKDRDRNGAIDDVTTFEGIGEGRHELHDMGSVQYRPEVLGQLQELYPLTKKLFQKLGEYDARIKKGENFDETDTGKPNKIETNDKRNLLFKGINLSLDGNPLTIYDLNRDGIVDLVLYKTDLSDGNPQKESQCYFTEGFKKFNAQNKIRMPKEIGTMANQILQQGLRIFSKFEKGIVVDRDTEDSYFAVGGSRGVFLYNIGNIK